MTDLISDLYSRAVSKFFDPFIERKPEIEWVKWVENSSLVNLMRTSAPEATASIAKVESISGQFWIKTEDGEVYKRYADDPKKKWTEVTGYEFKEFRSAYLESVIKNAHDRGLKIQPSASEISRGLLGRNTARMAVIWAGTDEEFARVDIDYPRPPHDFDDMHVPADFAKLHPNFAAYLDRHSYGPLWYKTGYDAPSEEVKDEPNPG